MGTDSVIIKVSSRSFVKASAGAIAARIREGCKVEVQAIGASAVNQAVKAVAIARKYLSLEDVDLICRPTFTEVDFDGDERTAIALLVEKNS